MEAGRCVLSGLFEPDPATISNDNDCQRGGAGGVFPYMAVSYRVNWKLRPLSKYRFCQTWKIKLIYWDIC